eukprot:g13650.t1 g13650   contig9:131206-132011(+)
MHDYIKGARLSGGSTLPAVDKLRISIHIASSVADLHETGEDESVPAFYHNDICCHQYLFQNGLFKLNDFNYARPILRNKQTKDVCLQKESNMGMWKGRSLEDHRRKTPGFDLQPFMPDKTDVWMMGNVIYIILTDLYTFEKPQRLSVEETSAALVAGKRSPIPDNIASSDDPSYVAIRMALDMCWKQEWRERSSARAVSDYLIGELKRITGEEDPGLRVKLPERDSNQRPTDNEFTKMGY